MAIDATLGGAASNSYISQSDATAYFVDRLDSADWENASPREQQNALMMATLRLEAETYRGAKAYQGQRLSWPRYSTYDRDDLVFDHTTIPVIVQAATCELALALLKEPESWDATGLEGFLNVKVGSLDVTPRTNTGSTSLPSLVKALLQPVLAAGLGTRVVRA